MSTTDRQIPAAPVSFLPAIHRRAAAAGLHRDHLEVAVGPDGQLVARIVRGAPVPA